MLFSDLYIGVPPGQTYPDMAEVLRFNSDLSDKDMLLDSTIGLDLESSLDKEMELDGPVWS